MRDYGKVYSTFWSSETTGSLSDDGKLLALYLMTCSHSTIAGVFRLPDGYVSEDLGWVTERVRQGLAELFAKGFANRCETTKWVFVRKHLEWNKPENPNQRKSAAKIAAGIPRDCCWGPEFSRTYDAFLGVESREPWNPSVTVPKPFLNQEQKQEQEQECSEAKASGGTPPPALAVVPELPKPQAAEPPSEDAKPMTAKDRVWLLGPPLLGESARGLLGKLAKAYGEETLAEVLAQATLERPIEPKAWVTAACETRAKAQPRANGRQPEQPGLLDDPRPDWALAAGFPDRFHAENAGCTKGTAKHFREGRRMAA